MPPRVPKPLVVGPDILFSFFKRDSAERRLIAELPNCGCRLVTPESAMEELVSKREEIMGFAGIDESEFWSSLSLLRNRVETVSKSEYEEFLPDAKKIFAHQE